MILTVYSRPGCHLCEEAVGDLAALQTAYPSLEIEEVNIEEDDELLRRYLELIPVVAFGDEELSSLVLDLEAVEQRLCNP